MRHETWPARLRFIWGGTVAALLAATAFAAPAAAAKPKKPDP